MAQCGRSLRSVQSAQVKSLRHASAAIAKRAHVARADRGEAGIPAELSARELARLSLLGQRDRELKRHVAQLEEHRPPKATDAGSSPVVTTNMDGEPERSSALF